MTISFCLMAMSGRGAIRAGRGREPGRSGDQGVGSLDRETAGRPSRVRFANSAGVPALTTKLRVAKLVPELSIATAVSPQFQRRVMAVTVVPMMARPYRPGAHSCGVIR